MNDTTKIWRVDAFKRVVREYEAAVAAHGVVVPIITVAESLGVSHQRVGSLLDEGRIASVMVTGRRYVKAESVFAYLAAGPGKPGRPKKLSKVMNSVRWAAKC